MAALNKIFKSPLKMFNRSFLKEKTVEQSLSKRLKLTGSADEKQKEIRLAESVNKICTCGGKNYFSALAGVLSVPARAGISSLTDRWIQTHIKAAEKLGAQPAVCFGTAGHPEKDFSRWKGSLNVTRNF